MHIEALRPDAAVLDCQFPLGQPQIIDGAQSLYVDVWAATLSSAVLHVAPTRRLRPSGWGSLSSSGLYLSRR